MGRMRNTIISKVRAGGVGDTGWGLLAISVSLAGSGRLSYGRGTEAPEHIVEFRARLTGTVCPPWRSSVDVNRCFTNGYV
jgi:hypothetical protein